MKTKVVNQANTILLELKNESIVTKRNALIELCRGALTKCKCEITDDIREVLELAKVLK